MRKTKSVQHLQSIKVNDEYGTPHSLFLEKCLKFDCSPSVDYFASDKNHVLDKYYTKKDDAFKREWYHNGFCNFPYSMMEECLKKAWEEHEDHTIVKAMVAERSVFFCLLPFFRYAGDAGLRTISADISRDEQIHVATNSLVCRELGLNPSKSLNKLRKATVDWVFQPLQAENPDKFLAKNFWHSQSDSLFEKGIAEGFSNTRSARMPAFFEHSNVNLPQYA